MTPAEFRQKVNSLCSVIAGMPPMDKATIDSLYYDVAIKLATMIDFASLRSENRQDIVAGTTDYYLPLDLHQCVDVRILDVDTEYTSLYCVELAEVRNSGEPTVYAHVGVERSAGANLGKRVIRLTPQSDNITNGLQVIYKKKPDRLATISDTADILDFPDDALAIIPYEACYLWFAGQGIKANKDVAAWHVYFMEEVTRIRQFLSSQYERDVRSIVKADHSFGTYFDL